MNTKIVQLFLIFLPFSCLSLETDTISSSSVLKDPDTIVSSKHIFKFGFFTVPNTTNRYLGIFYTFSEQTVVWIANREKPLKDSSNYVIISKDGNLALINSSNQTLWSTNTTFSNTNTTLQLQDNGNLILRDEATGSLLWESFSLPSNCFLPTMRVTHNIKTGKKTYTSSWKNTSDPGVGSFTGGIDVTNNILQFFIEKNGQPFWRSGQWNGRFFIGIKSMFDSYLDLFIVGNDHNNTFYFTQPEGKYAMKMCVNTTGSLVQTVWNQQRKSWITAWWAPRNECDFYGRCGPFGRCNEEDSPICSCMRGFEPVDKDEWGRGNWSGGCRRKKELECGNSNNGDGFVRMKFMKVPDFAQPFSSYDIDECRRRCLGNCSCVAYAHEQNIGCMIWSGSLIDAEEFNTVGVDLYIRLSASDLDKAKNRKLYIIIPVVGFVFVSIFGFVAWCFIVKRKGAKTRERNVVSPGQRFSTGSDAMLLRDESNNANIDQLPLFTFETLANATNNFHENNLLGRGGFGPVYKGNLADGKEIAVKRLSEASGQGVEEFMNEVIVISKLQHRNLVRLIGCCVEKDEKMLIYEYMSNKSLDICLFDSRLRTKNILDWTKCFGIIEGIGRGILYLHKDSRLTIIHRDLKPSNVLLDEDWNPKISDFGMARIFGCNEDQGNTARVVGTYGYMAPEYATEGIFSEKSDVYSFGVLVLEIVKGKKNMHYYNHEWSLGLLDYAWKLWSERNGFAFVDERIANLDLKIEMERCIQIALLCVQEFPKDRPTIQTVVSMLSHEIVDIPSPEQPGFAQNGSTRPAVDSSNGLTLTVLDGR